MEMKSRNKKALEGEESPGGAGVEVSDAERASKFQSAALCSLVAKSMSGPDQTLGSDMVLIRSDPARSIAQTQWCSPSSVCTPPGVQGPDGCGPRTGTSGSAYSAGIAGTWQGQAGAPC